MMFPFQTSGYNQLVSGRLLRGLTTPFACSVLGTASVHQDEILASSVFVDNTSVRTHRPLVPSGTLRRICYYPSYIDVLQTPSLLTSVLPCQCYGFVCSSFRFAGAYHASY